MPSGALAKEGRLIPVSFEWQAIHHHYVRKSLRDVGLSAGALVVRLFDIVNRLITKVLVTWPHGYVASSVIIVSVVVQRSLKRKFQSNPTEQCRLRDFVSSYVGARYGARHKASVRLTAKAAELSSVREIREWIVRCQLGSFLGRRLSMRVLKCNKGTWWMPWRQEAMKDVAPCEKLRGVASTL